MPSLHRKITRSITRDWPATNPSIYAETQHLVAHHGQTLQNSSTSGHLSESTQEALPRPEASFEGVPRPPKKLPIEQYLEDHVSSHLVHLSAHDVLPPNKYTNPMPSPLVTLFNWRHSTTAKHKPVTHSVGKSTEEQLNYIAEDEDGLNVSFHGNKRKHMLRDTSGKFRSTTDYLGLFRSSKPKICLTSTRDNSGLKSKSLEHQRQKEMETLLMINPKREAGDEYSRIFDTRPSEQFLAEMSKVGINAPAGIKHLGYRGRLMGNFESLNSQSNLEQHNRYFLNLVARSFNESQKEQLKTFHKSRSNIKQPNLSSSQEPNHNRKSEANILATILQSRSNMVVSLPNPLIRMPDTPILPPEQTSPIPILPVHLLTPHLDFNEFYNPVRLGRPPSDHPSEHRSHATHQTRMKLGSDIGMKHRRERQGGRETHTGRSTEEKSVSSGTHRRPLSRGPSLHGSTLSRDRSAKTRSKLGLGTEAKLNGDDADEEVDEEEAKDRMSHLDEGKVSLGKQMLADLARQSKGNSSDKHSEVDSDQEKSNSDSEDRAGFKVPKKNLELKPIVNIRRHSGSGVDVAKIGKTPRDSEDAATPSNKADSSSSNVFLYMDEKKVRPRAQGHQKILSPLVQIKQSSRRGGEKLVSQKSYDSGSKKSNSRKFGDPASSVSSYINPGGEYVSFWMTCISNCLEQKDLTKFENIGFSETFNTAIAKQTAAQLAGGRMSTQGGGARLTGRTMVFPPPDVGRSSRTAVAPGLGAAPNKFTHRRTLFVQAPVFKPRVIPDRMELAHHLVISIMEKLALLNWLDTEREDRILQCHHQQGSSREIYMEIRAQPNVLTFTNESGQEVPGYATCPAKVEPGQMVEIDFELSKYLSTLEHARIERIRTKGYTEFDREQMNFDSGLALAEEKEDTISEED